MHALQSALSSLAPRGKRAAAADALSGQNASTSNSDILRLQLSLY